MASVSYDIDIPHQKNTQDAKNGKVNAPSDRGLTLLSCELVSLTISAGNIIDNMLASTITRAAKKITNEYRDVCFALLIKDHLSFE